MNVHDALEVINKLAKDEISKDLYLVIGYIKDKSSDEYNFTITDSMSSEESIYISTKLFYYYSIGQKTRVISRLGWTNVGGMDVASAINVQHMSRVNG